MGFIAGPYNLTFDGNDVGETEEGFFIEDTPLGEPIVGHSLGRSTQDGVYQGIDSFLNMVLQEFRRLDTDPDPDVDVPFEMMWPWYTQRGIIGTPGRLWSSLAAPLVATRIAATVSAYPQVITFPYIYPAENFPIRLFHGSRLKNVPLRFRVLPSTQTVNSQSTAGVLYIETNPA